MITKIAISADNELPSNLEEMAVYDATGHTWTFEVPGKFEICPRCEGHGTVLNPSMAGHAYSQEEFSEFSEWESKQYFKRGGCYDVACECRDGKVVVPNVHSTHPLHQVVRMWKEEERRDKLERRQEARTMMREMGMM